MKKVLITLPNSIAGTLIMHGFKQGFKSNGAYSYAKDLKDLTIDDVRKFKPDIIMGYDYGFLFSDDCSLKLDLLDYARENGVSLVHYFADEPNNRYAYVNKDYLYNDFCELSNKYNIMNFVWDKVFVDCIPNAQYLPLAVNYKAYRPADENSGKKYDITFVGRPLSDIRQRILAELIKYFGDKLNIFCYEKHFLQSLDDMKNKKLLDDEELDIYKSSYRGFLKTEQEMSAVYYNSKVNINITLQGKSGLNYRVFEVLASRGFLITDCLPDIENLFDVSRELEVYKDTLELIDKIEFYLKNQLIAQKIALLGLSNVTKKHTYTARARKILESL